MWILLSIYSTVFFQLVEAFIQDIHGCFTNGTKQLICHKIIPNTNSILYPSIIESLKLMEFQQEIFQFSFISDNFLNLKNLSIVGNDKEKLRKMILSKGRLNIKVLELNNLQIDYLDEGFLDAFPDLEVFNLRGNSFTELPNISYDRLKEVYLADNKWNCSKDLNWILTLNKTVFRDLDDLKCYRMPHNNKPVLAIAEFRKITAESCTPNCSCHLIKCITYMNSGNLEPIIEVNCSYRNLKQLPDTFPLKTKTLHLEGNLIDDLSSITNNPLYRNLLDLHLDDNRLTNINILEGSHWLTHFRILSVRNNQITELPTHALDDALKHNINMPDAVRLTLGGNPWRCNCVFTPRFKEMLQKYSDQIQDIRDIKCGNGDENSFIPVIDLSRSSVCHSPSEYSIQEALNLLNAVLGSLIIFILVKLAYDYYNFKKTGRLPWIVTKLP